MLSKGYGHFITVFFSSFIKAKGANLFFTGA